MSEQKMNNHNAKQRQSQQKIRLLSNLLDYLLFIFSTIIIIVSIVISSEIFYRQLVNPLTNILLTILNILATVFISYKITYFFSLNQHLITQKKLAKTSIRYIRSYLLSLLRLEELVYDKMKQLDSDPLKQHFSEIRNIILTIRNFASNAEYDFKEIVNEEYQQETSLLEDIKYQYSDLVGISKRIEELQNQQNTAAIDTNEELIKLKYEMQGMSKKLNDSIESLPFGRSITWLTIKESEEGYLQDIKPPKGLNKFSDLDFNMFRYKCMKCGNTFVSFIIPAEKCTNCNSPDIKVYTPAE